MYQASPWEGRGLVHTVYTRNITCMCKQCVPGLSSGGEGPGTHCLHWEYYAHVQAVCTRPLLGGGEGPGDWPGDEAKV